jgi:hypothetical protein
MINAIVGGLFYYINEFWKNFIFNLNVWQNIWSSLLVIILGIIFIIIFQKRKLLEFFGLNKSKKLTVYFSTLFIPTGTANTHNLQNISFQGPAIPEYEYKVIPFFSELFTSINVGESVLSGIINRLLIGDAVITYLSSPLTFNSTSSNNIISLGGPGANVVTYNFMINRQTWLKFTNNNSSIEIAKGKAKGKIIGIATMQDDFGILEKVFDSKNNRFIFIAAGVNYSATMGTAYYLAMNWKTLHKEYGNKEFALCLKVAQPHIDPDGYKYPQIIYKRG